MPIRHLFNGTVVRVVHGKRISNCVCPGFSLAEVDDVAGRSFNVKELGVVHEASDITLGVAAKGADGLAAAGRFPAQSALKSKSYES